MSNHLPIDPPPFGSAAQHLLLEISAILVDSLEYRTTLARVARAVAVALADVCFIDGVAGEEGLERLASAHADPGQSGLVDSLSRQFAPIQTAGHPLIQVVQSGQTAWGSLVGADDSRHLRRLHALGCHSYIIAPLRARQRVLGTLMLGRLPGTPAFTPGDVTLSEEVAGRVANAVEIAQLYESERRLRWLAERSAQRITLLQQVTAALSGAVTPADVAAVAVNDGFAIAGVTAGSMYRLSEDGLRLEKITALNYPPAVMAQYAVIPLDSDVPIAYAAQTREAFFISDLEDYPRFAQALGSARSLTGSQSYAMLPLIVQDRLIGVMGLSFQERQEFPAEDRTLLLALASQCAQALERADLFEAERTAKAMAEQAREQVRFLADASIVLSSSLDLETTLVTLAELVVQSLAEWCVLYITTLDNGVIRYVAAASQRVLPSRSWAPGDCSWEERPSALGVPAVIASGAPLLIPAVAPETLRDYAVSEAQVAGLVKRAISSFMVVPLVARSQVLGTLSLARTTDHPPYSPADLDLVRELARRAASAIENARLYQQSRRSEETRRQSLLLLDALFDHAPVGMGFWDRDLRFVRVNPTLAAMNARSADEHIGRRLDELLPEATSVRDDLLAVLRTGQAVTNREVFDGSLGPFSLRRTWQTSYYPIPAADGSIQGVGGMVEEISERKRVEEQLRFFGEVSKVLAGSLEYETTVANITHLAVPKLADWAAVAMLDEEGHVEVQSWTSYDGQSWPAADQLWLLTLSGGAPLVDQALAGGATVRIAAASPDSAPFVEWFEAAGCHTVLIVPLLVRGAALGVLALALTRPERTCAEADLALAEEMGRRAAVALDNARLYAEAGRALRVRDHFLSVASHELKTPITSMMGYTQLLLRWIGRNPDSDERTLRALNAISNQSERLNRLIMSLLDLSRLQVGQLTIEQQPLDIVRLAGRVVADFEPTLDYHRISSLLPSQPIMVAGDELRLEQVLINLLQNAVKYSPSGGEITMSVSQTAAMAVISVTDSGIGIPSAALPQLFGQFYRATNITPNISGLGLGLYIVKEIVTLHGGTITVRSVEDYGSTFTVQLPLM